MAYTVEDGTGIDDANGYESLANIRAYAANRGVVLSAVDADLIPLAVKATDYLESKADRYVGVPVSPSQSLSWPRAKVIQVDGSPFPSNAIPQALKNCQSQLCIEQFNGVVLLPTTDYGATGGFVVREKVAELETQYSERIGTTLEPVMPAVDSLLNSLLVAIPALRSIRV